MKGPQKLLTLLSVFLALLLATGSAGAAPVVKVGSQAGGTFAWTIYTIQKYDLDEKYGFTMDVQTFATKKAAEIAFRNGTVDLAVNDFISVNLQRKAGLDVKAIYPFSLAVGGIVVPADGEIDTIKDLRGKKIGVAGLSDKSYLILRALATTRYGFDPQDESDVLALAPPMMGQQLKSGRLDAAVPYWHYVARYVHTGKFRELAQVTELLDELGLSTNLPILVIVARSDAIEQHREAMKGFISAMREAWDHMKSEPALWQEFLDHDLYSLPDPSAIDSVRRKWARGIPGPWTQETIQGLVDLTRRLVDIAGADVVGVSRIDPAAYTTLLSNR